MNATNVILDSEKFSANIAWLLFWHFMGFLITSAYTLYMSTRDLKGSILLLLQERISPIIYYASLLLMLTKVVFGVDIRINYIAEIFFALLFCTFIFAQSKNKKHFNAQIFFGGQLVFVIIFSLFVFLKFPASVV